jgi:hypothetical protein
MKTLVFSLLDSACRGQFYDREFALRGEHTCNNVGDGIAAKGYRSSQGLLLFLKWTAENPAMSQVPR